MSAPTYEQASTWQHDVYGALRASRQRAWILATVSCCMTALALVALVLLIPLHQTVPYVIQHDPDTGLLRALQPVAHGELTQNQAYIQHALVEYVQNREGYDRGSIESAIQKLFVTSTGQAWEDFNATLVDGHPENPVGKYGDRATVHVRVKSVSFLGDNAASVRFATDARQGGTSNKQHWVAVIGYRFVQSPASQEVRFINPLGFQVTTYRRSSEVVSDE